MKFASIVCSLLLVVCAFGYRVYAQPMQVAIAGQRYELAVHLKGQAVAVNVAPIGTLVGAQSLTAEQIDVILNECNSPAKSTGADWVTAGNHYGIDAAYAVAFFYHESTCGSNAAWAGIKPDGTTTHNVGNIICAGYATCFGRFRDYPDWQAGINDWFRLIAIEYVQQRGLTTVAGIIPVYAPSSDNNDVDGYVGAVNELVTEWRAEPLVTASDKRLLLVAYATSLVGIPYVRGGRSASGGDCSGTMQHVYLTVAGVDIGATTFSQYPALKPIELAQVQPGDLWYGQYFNDQHTGMIADIDGDGKWDLINNGGLQDTMHIDYDFLNTPYFSDHTMGFRAAL